MSRDIKVPNVDIPLLRNQRDALLKVSQDNKLYMGKKTYDHLNGLIELLDTMLDIAEGHYIKTLRKIRTYEKVNP